MIPDEIFIKIVRSAVRSPSAHNTQPWLFAKQDDDLCIVPDFSRSLPVADPDQRELFISLGCAAETAMISARFYGYRPTLQINALSRDCPINISLQKDDLIEKPALFSYIKVRQTTRNRYAGTAVTHEDITALVKVADADRIRFYIGQNEIQPFGSFIAEANDIQMSNPKFVNELIHWVRFSKKEAMQKGDGLYTSCSGLPSFGRVLGSFVLRNAVTAGSENKRLLNQLKKTAVIALFTTPGNNPENWIKTGMVFQRFALTAASLKLSHSHLNSPCQITEVRDKMRSYLGLKGEFPQLLIRLGFSHKMPDSFRRSVNDVIIKPKK
ncbi:MAG: hypothetical protein EA360_09355 [Balneolaceae bacterium]|nr:MAG: hypothetical protein EA360_09355 [Balneolaceae bacterium]